MYGIYFGGTNTEQKAMYEELCDHAVSKVGSQEFAIANGVAANEI